MTYSVDQLKGEIGRGGGIAKGSLFRVLMPIIPEIYLNLTGIDVATSQQLNILCKQVNMPGRQLLTNDRIIGTVSQKVAYGYANEDVNITFIGLNNYVVRKYLEDWQDYAMNPNSFEVKYKTQYAKNMTIQQLDMHHRVVYSIVLEKAFPTQILNVDFSNDASGPIDIGATFSYTKWRRQDIISDAISTEAQQFLENLILRN